MDVQIVHNQMNSSGGGVLESQFDGDPGEFIRRAVRHGEDEVEPALGSTGQKILAVPRRWYSLSCRASRPGLAGDAGRTSACSVAGFSSGQTIGSCVLQGRS